MSNNNLSRLKTVGANCGTDAVAAPAPLQIGTLTGASALVTATANHARTASTKPNDGGGQRVQV